MQDDISTDNKLPVAESSDIQKNVVTHNHSPSMAKRVVRALLYWLVMASAIVSGISYSGNLLNNLHQTYMQWPTLVLVMCVCFLICLVYVNVYVLAPIHLVSPLESSDIKKSEKRKVEKIILGMKRKEARYIISLYTLLFFIFPFIVNLFYVAYGKSNGKLFLYILLFLIFPSLWYVFTIFYKSGRFYSVPNKIDESLFLFRHLLFTPGLLLIAVPFTIGYLIVNEPSKHQLLFMGCIQLAYALICFTSENFKFKIPFIRTNEKLNLFIILCLALLTSCNIVAYNTTTANIKFIAFAINLSLFMSAYEFFGTIYFKNTENIIRNKYGLDQIDLNEKYPMYYRAGASGLTALTCLFPLTYVLNKNFTHVYLLPVFFVLLIIWLSWMFLAQTFMENDERADNLRKSKILALTAPVFIIINSIFHGNLIVWSESKVFAASGILLGILITVFVGYFTPWLKLKNKCTSYIWLGAFTMSLIAFSIPSTDVLNSDRPLALSSAYLYFSIFSIIAIVFSERSQLTEKNRA